MPRKVKVRRRVNPERTRIRISERRKKRRQILMSIAALLILILFGLFLYIVRLPSLTLQSVNVEGAYSVRGSEVAASVEATLDDGKFHIIPQRMIFAYPKGKLIKQLLLQSPRIQGAEITRDAFLSTEILVNIKERVAYGVWCTEEMVSCYYLDAEGFTYAPADSFAEWTVFLGGMEKPEAPITSHFFSGNMGQLRDLLVALSKQGLDSRVVSIDSLEDVDIEFLNGLHVRISFTQSTEEILSALLAALNSETISSREEDVEYIDVRFGNRVYFKFKE